RVLRPNFSVDQLVFLGDEQEDTFHVGTLIGDEVAGIMTVMRDPQPGEPGEAGEAWRTRGMATAPEHRGSGLGRAMIDFGCSLAWKKSRRPIWCNAREVAFGFYEKFGFVKVGGLFDIEDIGVHSVMVLAGEE
ncbi:MAG: GNAT family N-acetyltransferase, partial [Phycisphaerales bacterium]|nr:GNAT family N-acetyltransferase [Phycisphaerales bacterium]